MKKNIYSLLLSEALIVRLDEQAQSKSRSRSQMIEEILADHLELNTPQISVNRLLERVYEDLGKTSKFEMLARNKGNAIQMRTELGFKYSPKVRYMLDIKSRKGAFDGLLKIIPRTQSTEFMSLLVRFFDHVNSFEREHSLLKTTWEPVISNSYSYDGSRFMKPIMMKEQDLKVDGGRKASTALSAYINCLNEAIGLYFGQSTMDDEGLLDCYRRHGVVD